MGVTRQLTLKRVCVAGVPKTVNFFARSAVSEGADHTRSADLVKSMRELRNFVKKSLKTAINYTGEKSIEKLLQFRTTSKTKLFFSTQKSAKSSHPSGEETAPEGLQTFRGTDFFGHMSKTFRVTAQKNADFC